MKQDEFERLNKIVTELEKMVQSRGDELMLAALHAGVGILERFVVAIERIAAQGEPAVTTTEQAPYSAT